MTYYLQMDGVDDKIALPSLTFDKIVIDGLLDSTQSVLRYLLQTVTGTSIYARLAADDSIQLLAVTQTGFSLDTRTTLTLTCTTVPSTATLNVFVRSDGGASFAKGRLYNIKFYNGASIVAHYDMDTQTVQDQSGNGKHATLTGGTWVSDSSGTDANVSSITATATNAAVTPSISAQVSISISSVTAAASSQVISPSVSSSNAVSISSSVATVSSSGISPSVSTGVNISSTLSNAVASAMTPFIGSVAIAVNSVAASASSQFVPPNVTIAYEIISVVNLEGIKTFIVPLQGSKEQTVQVLGLKDNIVLLEGEI